MAMNLYLVANCKNPACRQICAFKYMGPDIGQVEIAELTPTGFQYECGGCRQQHRYELEDLRMERLPSPPPPGWENGF